MRDIIDLLDKEKMIEFGYVCEYGSCRTAYVLEYLTFHECQMLAGEIDFKIGKGLVEGNSGEVMYCITDIQECWGWVEDLVFETPQLALQRLAHVLLDIGIAVIPKENIEQLAVIKRVSIRDIEVLNGLTKDNVDGDRYYAKNKSVNK